MGNIGCGPASDQGVCWEDHPENETPMLPLRDSAKNFITRQTPPVREAETKGGSGRKIY